MSNTEEWQDEISRMDNCETLYQILKLTKHATTEEITEACHKYRLIFESAKNPTSRTKDGLHKIRKAYDILTDKRFRKCYDRVLNADEIICGDIANKEEDQQEEESLLPARAPRRRPISTERPRSADREARGIDLELGPLGAEPNQESVQLGSSSVRYHVRRPEDFGSNDLQIHYIVQAPEESLCFKICNSLTPMLCLIFAILLVVAYLYAIRVI